MEEGRPRPPFFVLNTFQNFAWLDTAGGELRDERAVGGEKVVLAKFAGEDPGDLLERNGFDGVAFDCRCKEADFEFFIATGVLVLNLAEFDAFGQRGAKLLAQFSSERCFGSFTFFELAAGKFPLERRRIVPSALADQDAAVGALDDGSDDDDHASLPIC